MYIILYNINVFIISTFSWDKSKNFNAQRDGNRGTQVNRADVKNVKIRTKTFENSKEI